MTYKRCSEVPLLCHWKRLSWAHEKQVPLLTFTDSVREETAINKISRRHYSAKFNRDKPMNEEGDCGSYGYRELYKTVSAGSVNNNGDYELLGL